MERTRESDFECLELRPLAEALEQPSVQARLVSAFGITLQRNRQLGDRGVFRLEAGVDALEPQETVRQQSRAGQQHERQCDLCDDERGAPARARASSLARLLDDTRGPRP